jgi:hypothetical protein
MDSKPLLRFYICYFNARNKEGGKVHVLLPETGENYSVSTMSRNILGGCLRYMNILELAFFFVGGWEKGSSSGGGDGGDVHQCFVVIIPTWRTLPFSAVYSM